MRWFWIDRFIEFDSGRTATAVKCLSHAEDHFTEHFPAFPVMPATLILEGLAQTGGILVGEANQFREKVVLAKVPFARFHREAFPGDQLTYHAELVSLRPEGGVVRGKVTSGTQLIAEAEIFFAHLDQNRAGAIFGEDNFVFDGGLRSLVASAKLPAARTADTSSLPASS
jgi:3-hydroxyacyl-[acyl-carrier-protein] dehydratase